MDFQVEIQSENGIFSPGQTVHALVILNLKKSIKVKAIRVHAVGKARTHWTEQQRNGREERSVTYAAELYYLDYEVELWRAAEDGKLHAGRYTFPFCFTLPTELPPAFEGTVGFIRYYCEATLERPWYRSDKRTGSTFGVVPHFDLNTVPDAARPEVREVTKNVGVLMFKHGRVSASVTIPKTGFVPGELLPVNFLISNSSSRPVDRIEIELIECVEYVAFRDGRRIFDHNDSCWGGYTRTHTRSVMKTGEDVVVAPQSSAQIDRALPIPPTSPSFLCPIIRATYYVTVRIRTQGLVGNALKTEIPLLIGTVPLVPGAGHSKSMDELSSAGPSAPSANEPPPSYAESVFEKGTLHDDSDTSPPVYTSK